MASCSEARRAFFGGIQLFSYFPFLSHVSIFLYDLNDRVSLLIFIHGNHGLYDQLRTE